MKATGWQLGLAGALSCTALAMGGTLAACASDENDTHVGDDPSTSVPVQPDGGASDAATEADASPCADCDYFPASCELDILCPNGPFDPSNPDVGMDWRTRINVIRGRSASDVWLAGTVGAMAHFDGTSWAVSEVGTKESQRAIWLASGGELTLGSVHGMYSRGLGDGGADAGVSPGGWTLHAMPELPPDFGAALKAGWSAPGSSSFWIATESTMWRLQLTDTSTIEVGAGIPSGSCREVLCSQIASIHGASAKTLWAVGDFGAALRITDADGETPSATLLNSLTLQRLTSVWAASDTDVWAVGGSGTIRHYTGAPLQWDVIEGVPTNENLNAVWGTSSSDVWAVGNAGVVLHYDGASWSRVKIAGLGARRPDLYSVWSSGPGHVWIGGYGVVLALGGKP